MNKTQSPASTTRSESFHHSDGSELVPAEVQANKRHDEHAEGTLSEGSREQRRYIYWGIAATLLVAALVLISKFVS